ncbi:MAG: hypothetical protein EU532_11810 [Promethearchaeota archaeon]|nr:MAG: hypothetical protein EU532_11810 [Candidatus Lokiarchaeota archaeon]
MKIFEWAEDLEKIYEDLLKKAKDQNFEEIEELKKNTQKDLEESQNTKNKLVKDALNSLRDDVSTEISQFKANLEKILHEFERNYDQNKKNMIRKIIKELGLDFSD